MSRNERRLVRNAMKKQARKFSNKLTLVPKDEWPGVLPNQLAVYRSKKFLVQAFSSLEGQSGMIIRLSICRTTKDVKGEWVAKITWDELQQIKAEVGFADWYGVEIYPREKDLVNVANMRHLWLMPVALNIGWFTNGPD